MTITFIGHGYVGLVTAAVFADLGNTVWVIGHTPQKINDLKKGILPIFEPGLEEVVKRNIHAKRLFFTLEYTHAIPNSNVIFITVGTPPLPSGAADLSVVYSVAQQSARYLQGYAVVVTKSTVPVGTFKKIKKIIHDAKTENSLFDIASVPEFLREGQAIGDTLHPDRIIIGTESKRAENILLELHKPIDGKVLLTNIPTAEMIKYAANAALATKISFANAIAQLSEKSGADGVAVLEAVGLDKRIGASFLQAGAGFGGSCFPKDVKALVEIAKTYDYDFSLLKEVEQINQAAMRNIVEKARNLLGDVQGKTIGILGLSFKPDTDDMRDAPSLVIIKELQAMGAKIKAYDPIAMENAKKLISNVTFCNNVHDTAKESELIIIVTEWNEFKELDLVRLKSYMKKCNLIDARNIYDPLKVTALGYAYKGVGR